VPDLQVLPPEHRTMTDIWMGAGPVPEILHRILNLLAKMRARFHLPSLKPFSGLFYKVLNLMKFGEHRGGMFVQARGIADGRSVEQSWHLIAEGDDGPYIPSMAIEGLIRKLLAGECLAAGARPGTHALELSDYDTLFANRDIYTGFRKEAKIQPLYPQLLGSAFKRLPQALQALHGSDSKRKWTGLAQVRKGHGLMASVLRTLIGFPGAGSMPVSVTFTPENGGERWTRNFGGKIFNSLQTAGTGDDQYLLVERFGIAAFSLALMVENRRLCLVPRRWTLLNIPMPKALLPKGVSFETEENGKFHFDVEISAPLVGLIVAYKGSLAWDEASTSN